MPATATTTAVEEFVTRSLVELGAETADVSRDATFEALDIDSLDLAELGQMVDDEFGVQLKSSDVRDVKTVGDVVDLIVSRAS